MSPDPSPACDDADWNEIWKARQKRHESSHSFNDPSHNWNRKENAERYDANSRSRYDERVKFTIEGLDINRNSRVLDIGSGPGTLAIPLSPLVKEITAVEPGEGMVATLNEHIRNEGITNISCVRKCWEDVDISRDLGGQYDVVIASLSLTMHDIRAALAKMDDASRKYVYLYWFVDSPFWEKMYNDLWEPLHGDPYYPGPKTDCLFNVLYQMGIYANVEILPLDKEYRFTSLEETVAFFRRRFSVMNSEQEGVLVEYLTPLIRQDGRDLVLSGDSTFAKIWWKKKRGDEWS
ncbi:MAG: class I SAM-dependent methyltransferase [Methanoregula sp.]|jgi:SAM-dependent methyltransferase|uniref:class I SAM-dependent methyltransferase n=1 Tax=Methanoregula sp. TaxID=2052170 RepID=UPI003D12A082